MIIYYEQKEMYKTREGAKRAPIVPGRNFLMMVAITFAITLPSFFGSRHGTGLYLDQVENQAYMVI